jgi:hypothetical protein
MSWRSTFFWCLFDMLKEQGEVGFAGLADTVVYGCAMAGQRWGIKWREERRGEKFDGSMHFL